MKAIMNDEVMERLIDTLMELQKKESTDLPLLKKQLAETEKGINNMLNAIQTGIFTPSTKQRLDELEKTKSQLEVSILQEEMHKLILTFNYKDGSKTITLAEVEGSDLSVLGAVNELVRETSIHSWVLIFFAEKGFWREACNFVLPKQFMTGILIP